ncbi:SO2930 family diheme c-type cytochrome [Polyangium aurulentum]|uniref:SO2930 family diheme c-type cytochrome n=1 Tax=Polyangium aurulentum TaxID=2567896 RepID=UPI0010ADF2E8|nr:SO2930 family diheme c-type cytochrome [Polyangium aurulentum]UQA62220.1 hypothetical protein E8A73_017820 [Polyangium aurulentum]
MISPKHFLAATLAFAFLPGCGAEGGGASTPAPKPDPAEIPYDTLSQYGFFSGNMADSKPAPGVIPYTVAAPLWSDGAGKERFIVLPEGKKATFGKDETWSLPDGTIIIKNFHFPLDAREPSGARRLIETRLLIRDEGEDEGWTAHTYVWNDEQTEARRTIAGKQVTVDFIDTQGKPASQQYLVPNTNQCGNCHERDDRYELLGLVTPQVNFDLPDAAGEKNQLARLAAAGMFDAALPPLADLPRLPDPLGNAPLDERARAYLHANCSHCHRPGGGGGASGLVLLATETNPTHYGVCKGSVAAGAGTGSHDYDIVPGMPDESIMPFRMRSTDPEIKMPEIPNLVPDDAGVELITAWIAAMAPPGCP